MALHERMEQRNFGWKNVYQVDAMPNWYQIDGNFNAIGWIYKTRDLIQMSTHVTKSYLPNDYIF